MITITIIVRAATPISTIYAAIIELACGPDELGEDVPEVGVGLDVKLGLEMILGVEIKDSLLGEIVGVEVELEVVDKIEEAVLGAFVCDPAAIAAAVLSISF